MSQAEVIEFLQKQRRKNPDKWWSSKEIAKALDMGVGTVITNLGRIRKGYPGEIRWKDFEEMCKYLYKGRKT